MPVLATLVGSKVAIAALAIAALGGGGAAVAVAASALPTPAHSASAPSPTVTATEPAADPGPTESPAPGSAVGPDVTGPAAFGLCTAYLAGGLGANSTPAASLIALAGADGVDAYCDLIVAVGHGQSQSEHGKPAQSEHGSHVTPERPAQSIKGTDHKPAEHPGR